MIRAGTEKNDGSKMIVGYFIKPDYIKYMKSVF